MGIGKNQTKGKKMLTTADLDRMYRNDEWEGFGYLGERRHQTQEARDAADTKVLAEANRLGLTADQLFEWANSRPGRWYGDCMFGANGQHADDYLPGKTLR